MWMNEYEIKDAARRYAGHAMFGPATQTLLGLMTAVNSCSDGWPYWKAPSTAAQKLQELITTADQARRDDRFRPDPEAEAAALKRAYTQLRRFRTAHPQVEFRIHGVTGWVAGDPEPEAPMSARQCGLDSGRVILQAEGHRPMAGFSVPLPGDPAARVQYLRDFAAGLADAAGEPYWKAPEQHTIRITVTGDRAVVEVTGGGPLPPGRYLGAVVKLTDRRAEAQAS